MANAGSMTVDVRVRVSPHPLLVEWGTEAMIRAAEEEGMYPDNGGVARLAAHLRRGARLVAESLEVSAAPDVIRGNQ